MSIYEEEVAGGEFDWYAIDIDGNIAQFSTAGEGSVPDRVVANYREHNKVSDTIETPNWGSENIWNDYAQIGFYVFDWKLNDGPYFKLKSPSKSMPLSIKKAILGITQIPKLPCSFNQISEFTISEPNM